MELPDDIELPQMRQFSSKQVSEVSPDLTGPCGLMSLVSKCPLSLSSFLRNRNESPLECKEIQRVHPKGDQSRVFIGRTDAEAETPILWPPDVKS